MEPLQWERLLTQEEPFKETAFWDKIRWTKSGGLRQGDQYRGPFQGDCIRVTL